MFEVRNPGGLKLGVIDIRDLKLLRRREVRFKRAGNVRHFGAGFRQLDDIGGAADLSFVSLDMPVALWWEAPTISESGEQYRPGRVDFCLTWDGPVEALFDVEGFTAL